MLGQASVGRGRTAAKRAEIHHWPALWPLPRARGNLESLEKSRLFALILHHLGGYEFYLPNGGDEER